MESIEGHERLRLVLRAVRAAWLAVGTTLLCLAALEGVSRIVLALRAHPAVDSRVDADAYPKEPWVAELYDENARSARMRWEPYVYWRRVPFAGRHINIDERGLRKTWTPPRTPGVPAVRIFLFGASDVWGTGERDDHTLPSELARFLWKGGVRAEVTNFGESGWVTTQSLIALVRELQRDNVPDVVVFHIGFNDTFSRFQNGMPGVPQNEARRVREFNLLRHARRLVMETFDAALGRSAFVELVRSDTPPFSPVPDPPPVVVEEALRTQDANFRAAEALATRWGFRFNVTWAPNLFTKPHLSPWEERSGERLAFTKSFILDLDGRVRRDWSARNASEFSYLGDLFEKTTAPRFIDHVHPGEVADREIAEAIGARLISHGRLGPARSTNSP